MQGNLIPPKKWGRTAIGAYLVANFIHNMPNALDIVFQKGQVSPTTAYVVQKWKCPTVKKLYTGLAHRTGILRQFGRFYAAFSCTGYPNVVAWRCPIAMPILRLLIWASGFVVTNSFSPVGKGCCGWGQFCTESSWYCKVWGLSWICSELTMAWPCSDKMCLYW